jgi:uncharacterized protein (DUF1800 family)
MTRMRQTLLAVLATGLAACSSGSRTVPVQTMPATPVAEPREQTADQQVTHLLSRLTFGARPGDAAKVRAIGVDAWIDQQLHPDRVDDSAFEAFANANYKLRPFTPAELEQRFPPPGQLLNQIAMQNGGRGGDPANPPSMSRADSARLRASNEGLRQMTMEVQSHRVARAVMSERQLHEVVTDFWLNHFSVYDAKGPRERYMLSEYENRVIRPNAFGKFRTLLGAVAKSEAMLFYLDNWQSQADPNRPRLAQLPAGRGGRGGRGVPQPPPQARRGGLNENYGRELLELHTLGVDGGYTQQDVINAARALTGWTMRPYPQGGGFQFVPAMHDAGEKPFLGQRLRAGRGIEDGEEVLDIVARHPSTAKYISFKLARRFVSDTPSAALVARAAETFTRTDGDLRETIRTIVTSGEFFSSRAFRSKVKSPFEVVTSAARALGATADPGPRMAQLVGQLGQPIYGHQAPNGWPETGDQWMNTGAILNRINFGMLVAAGRVPGASPLGFHDADVLQTAARELQVEGVVDALLGGSVSPETRQILMSGENPLAQAAEPAGNPPAGGRGRGGGGRGRGGNPLGGGPPEMMPGGGGRGFGPLPPLRGLTLVVGLALGSPEFQRR